MGFQTVTMALGPGRSLMTELFIIKLYDKTGASCVVQDPQLIIASLGFAKLENDLRQSLRC